MDLKQRRVRVLIVDDSAVVRQILSTELSADPEIEVVGTASDPYIARDKIIRDKPDVLTLDIEMPKMDGLTFLKKVMTYHPMPVIVLSSLAESGTNVALEALEWGAFEVFAKPQCDMRHGLRDSISHLAEAIKASARAKNIRRSPTIISSPTIKASNPTILRTTDKVIVIGASTGGTEAVKTVLASLPPDSPGVLAVIHMPEGFTSRYAQRLNDCCAIEIREAADGDLVHPGLALIAKGDSHLLLARSGAKYHAEVRKGPPVNRHRPSVEVLFQSAANAAGANALGIILTGMGADGADGLLAMRNSGAHTFAQDESSCVVFGMPREAIVRGAACEILPLDSIGAACGKWSQAQASAK